MAYVRYIKRGRSTYAYLVESYREKGKVKQRNLEYLGKVDGLSGEIIPPKHKRKIKTTLKRGISILEPLFMELRVALRKSFGTDRGDKLFYIALIEFLHPSPMRYISDSAESHGLCINLSPSGISKLFSGITEDEVYTFFRNISHDGSTLVFDITSLNYSGKSLDYAEYGYNRDGVHMPQVNLCLSVDMERDIPVYFRIFNGSIPDVSTVIHTINDLRAFGYTDSHFIFDRGFYSRINLAELAEFKYTGALPKSTKLFEELIRKHLDIEHLANVVEYRGDRIMVSEEIIDGIKYVIVYSPKLKYEQSDTFMDRLLRTEELLRRYCGKYDSYRLKELCKSYWNYFDVSGCNIRRKNKAIQRSVNLMGKYVLFTNDLDSSWREVLDRYREKDIIEKAFEALKNHGFLTPLRVWSDKTLYGKVFASFLFYWVYRRIMSRVDIPYEEVRWLFDGMLAVLYDDGREVDVELTKKQKNLLKSIGCSVQNGKK